MSASDKLWADNQPPQCDAADLNGFKNENSLLILGSNQALSTADNQQTHKAVASYAAVGQFMLGAGAADAYTAGAPAPRINPSARMSGMLIRFQAVANNTGACTINLFGLGNVDIKLSDGTTDPDADDIAAGKDTTVIDRGAFVELVRTGQVKNTVLSVSDPAWTPAPDAKSIKFTPVGAGGGGGGTDGQGAGTAAAGAGGGTGGSAELVDNAPSASYAVVIGAGGSGGAAGNNNGSAGGSTTVIGGAVNISAGGGGGGGGDLGAAGSAQIAGGSGGSSTGGQANFKGNTGDSATIVQGDISAVGNGAGSVLGGSTRGKTTAAGETAVTPGAGGSGAGSQDIATNNAGGDGADGVVTIKEYF